MTETTMPASEPGLRSAFIAPLVDVEYRQAGNSEDFTLTGHAAVFDKWSEDLWTFAGTFRERVARGAFADVLGRKPDVRLLLNHDGMTLARTKAGTLELSEDEEGLRVWARLAPTQTAKDLRMAMQRGDVDQMSFAFTVAEDEWREDHDADTVERTIMRVGDLFDVSVVSFPAYPDTDAAMRELRTAAAAGKIVVRAEEGSAGNVTWTATTFGVRASGAPAETDPVAEQTAPDSAPAETDPAVVDEGDAGAQAETDPAVGGIDDPVTVMREKARLERVSYLRLQRELKK